MTFTVTYRGADGALREERVEAASRVECVAECRRRGVAPVAIAERAGTRDACPCRRRRGDTPPYRVAVVAAVVLAVAGGAWWWMAGARDGRPGRAGMLEVSEATTANHDTRNAHDVQDAKGREIANVPAKDGDRPVPVVDDVSAGDPYDGVWRGQKIVSYTVKTNGWSTYEHIVTADGKSHGVIGSTVKPVFDNGSDQMLALAVQASQGSEMPPMPLSPMVERDFMESLKKPVVISEDDSEEVKNLKRGVMQAREDMMALMGKGMTVEQALAEHFKIANENIGIRNKAVEELRSILEVGDEEGANRYIEAVNGTLEKMGIMKLELPEERMRRRYRNDIEKGRSR